MRGSHLIDIDWLWDITEKELPIGEDEIEAQSTEFLITTTCAETAKPHYLAVQRSDIFQQLKASGCMPLAFKNNVIHAGKQWFDGGVSDSLPVKEAYNRGARKILVIRSNPASYRKKPYALKALFPLLLKRYPAIAASLAERHNHYNASLDFIRQPPKDCDIIEICPHDSFAAGQFTTDIHTLNQAYQLGIDDGLKTVQHW